jgi:hypothetical protein
VNLGQDSFARYTAPQALGSVGGEVLSHRFIASPCDIDNVVIAFTLFAFHMPFSLLRHN